MTSMWRTRRSAGRKNMINRGGKEKNLSMSISIPVNFLCPITLELMKDPVILPTGITYDRQSIETWFDVGNTTCPVTNQPLSNQDLIPNHSTRKMIQDWCVENRSNGIERIPTPRIPLSPAVMSRILTEIDSATQREDFVMCANLATKIREMAKESDRNRRCISASGVGRSLSTAFNKFSGSAEKGRQTFFTVLEDIISGLSETFPLSGDSSSQLTSSNSLSALISILNEGGLIGRRNAVLTLEELTHPERGGNCYIRSILDNQGQLVEGLVNLIKKPVSPTTTKSTLITSFRLTSSSERTAIRFAELGMVHLLIDLLVDSDKSTTEKALGVLDNICSSELGRKMAHDHALAVPVLVKKLFRVTDTSTEFAVSVIWKISKTHKESDGEKCLREAFQVGAFQKLLLLLQVGCGGKTKEKATELLKMMNSHKGDVDCFDPIDLKGLKRT